MKDAWIVVLEADDESNFWVCISRCDALEIAKNITGKLADRYEIFEVDETCYGDMAYHFDAEDYFRVYVRPQKIHETGEVSDGLNW